jgi:hypothetical protein
LIIVGAWIELRTAPRSGILNEQVKRNRERFADDFAMRLTSREALTIARSRSQSATLKRGQNIKYLGRKVSDLERQVAGNSNDIRRIFESLEELIEPIQSGTPRKIGFHSSNG